MFLVKQIVHFYQIQWSAGVYELVKNTNHLKFGIRQIFYASFIKRKQLVFFQDFWKSPEAHVKILLCILF